VQNILIIDGHKAVVSLDAEIQQFRGEFVALNGGADFYADNLHDLVEEGRKSLQLFLRVCKENNIDPYRNFSGRFNVRIKPQLHEKAVAAAKANNQSLNELVSTAIEYYAEQVNI